MSATFEIPDWLVQAAPSPAPTAPPIDEHRVEGLVNRFIAGKQEALFTAPDAFYRLQGAEAVQGRPAIAQRLLDLQSATLDQTPNDGEREALAPRLDLHIDDAMDGVDRHVAEQRRVYQRQVVSTRQALIQRAAELEPDNDEKLAGLAEANASAAVELARMNGQPEDPAGQDARSAIWRTAIDQRIARRNAPQALALFERVQEQLAPADRLSLDTPIQAARYEQAADQWISRESGADGPPLRERLDADADLPADAKPIVRVKLDARESADESARVAKVHALDDEVREAFRVQPVNPSAYKPGTFARIADAYDALGEPKRAEFARRMAAEEALIVPFTQMSVEKQQRTIDEWPEGDIRDSAIATRDRQTQEFAHDPFGAGTTLYKDVGPPVPIDNVEGRIRQARQIAQLRGGIFVAPFTLREMDAMRRTLAVGTEQEKQSVRDRLAALPVDVRPSIEPSPIPAPGSMRTFGIAAASGEPPQSMEGAGNAGPVPASAAAVQEGPRAPEPTPAPANPEHQTEAETPESDKPSYDDLSTWQQIKIEAERFFAEGERKGATFRADSAARHLQTMEELRQRSQTEQLNVTEKKFLLKNRNAASDLAAAVGQLVAAQRNLNALPNSDALRQLFEAKSVGEVASLLNEKSGKIASAVGLGSLPSLTMGIVATAALGPIGGGVALAGSAGLDGYAKGLIGALSLRGVDVANPDALATALKTKTLMDAVRKDATTDAAIEAGATSLAAMIGGARLRSARPRGQRPLSKAQQAAAKGKGPVWERETAANILKNKEQDLSQQVELRTASGIIIRMDHVVRNTRTGEIFTVDPKDIRRLRLQQPNQRIGYLEMEKTGAVITRLGWRSLPGRGKFSVGTRIPPKKVQIQTREGPYYIERPAGSKKIRLVPWKDPKGRLDDI